MSHNETYVVGIDVAYAIYMPTTLKYTIYPVMYILKYTY